MAPTDKFIEYNDQQNKKIAIVVIIDGVPGALTNGSVSQTLVYGLPGVDYGDPDLIYGGLVPLTSYGGGDVRPLLSLEKSSMTLSQRLEPEQGRAAVSTMSLGFIDKDGYMTELSSPGFIVDEILGRRVSVYLGYQELSFPEDYFIIFQGNITNVQNSPGVTTFQFSDPNMFRRNSVFYSAKTVLNGSIDDTVTTVNVNANGDFYEPILGPDGNYDSAITVYFKIDDEFIEYGPSFSNPTGTFGTNTFTNCVRGARNSVAAPHDDGAQVQAYIQIEDDAIDMALKLMLSGWGGDWSTGNAILNIVFTGDPVLMNQSGAIILPTNVNAVRDYNLLPGDYITISGDSNPTNNGTFIVVSFGDLFGESNRIIYTDGSAMVASISTSAVFSIRSQYDTYPVSCGSKLSPVDVDIERHLYIKTTFLPSSANSYRFLISAAESCKTFIENEIYLPAACYSLTRYGKLSIGITKPPIADINLPLLTSDNIINAPEISPNRGTNNRRFFNDIRWQYDLDDDGKYRSQYVGFDTDSYNLIGLISTLPINSKGARTDLGIKPFIVRRTQFLLSRYKRGATELNVRVNYGTGILIEAGDVVAVKDDGTLHIANYASGDRDLGTQLFEVTDRSIDLKSGNVSLKLVSGVGSDVTDRFATISPSSVIGTGSTTTNIIITDSFGAVFPGDEKKKWTDYIGQEILIRADDWSASETTTLTGFSPSNPYLMTVSPALSSPPPSGYIVDIIQYPTSTNPNDAQIYKIIHCFLDPNVKVVSGVSNTEFTVASGDIAKFFVGSILLVHQPEWTYQSPEVTVSAVDTGTNTVTVDTGLGFTPATSDQVELIGFADELGAYRFI